MERFTNPTGGSPLTIRAEPEGYRRGLKKRAVVTAFLIFSLTIALVMANAFSKKVKEEGLMRARLAIPAPSDAVKNLPSKYSDLKQEEPTKPLPAPVQIIEQRQTAEEKLLEELRLKRLRREAAARESDIFFTGVKLEETEPAPRKSLAQGGTPGASIEEAYGPEELNERENDNRQDEKAEFLDRGRDAETHSLKSIKRPSTPYEIMAGTIIPGLLITGINSDLPGKIIGQVSQNVFDTVSGRFLLLPQGTKVIGEYDSRIAYGQERVLIVWTRLLLPNGDSISLEGMPGVDMSGYAGLTDEVNHHYLRLLSGVVLGSLLGASVQMAEGRNYSTSDPSFGELAVQGAARNMNEAGQQITRKNLNIQPTLEISPGFRFNIFVTKDLTLKPYKQ